MKLNGQALVTGGASGLGVALTAKALASAKVKVAILDTDIEGAQHIAKEIDGIAIECDVSNEKVWRKSYRCRARKTRSCQSVNKLCWDRPC